MDSIKSAALKAMAYWKAMVEQYGHHHLWTMTAEFFACEANETACKELESVTPAHK